MVSVTLWNMARSAKVSAAFYDALVADHGPRLNWRVAEGPHVVVRGEDGEDMKVARLVINAAPHTRIHYLDRD